MFTGIVNDIGEVLAVEPRAEARPTSLVATIRKRLRSRTSIACGGVCLTVVRRNRAWFVDAAAETLKWVGAWQQGARI